LSREIDYNRRPRDRLEAGKGRSVRIGPGIMLHVSRTDPRYCRFSGWLLLSYDGKIFWLRNHSMLTAYTFVGERTPSGTT
jgi:hypothetical protein